MHPHIGSSGDRRAHRIYFVAAPSVNAIKIGITDNVRKRLNSLRGASPVPIELLLDVRALGIHERALHRRFAAYRRHAEWFEASPDLLAFVAELRDRDDDGVQLVLSTLPLEGPVIVEGSHQRRRAARLWSAVDRMLRGPA